MIRQAHTYLAGAVSGTALIGAAVVAFVLLVSLQALRDWPLAGIGGGESATRQDAPGVTNGAGAVAGQGGTGRAAAIEGRAGNGGQDGEAGLGRSPSASTGGPNVVPGTGTNPNGTGTGGSSTGGDGSASAGGGGAGGSGQSPSETVSGTVNGAVSEVDKATGGALGETGVTGAGEEVVNGVTGAGSAVGQAVDKAAETVGGAVGSTGP